MSWQKSKNRGEYICIVQKRTSWLEASRARRVVHTAVNQKDFPTKDCVRYKNRWHPLHKASEWPGFLALQKEQGVKVFLEWPITRFKKDALPFLLDWEEPGFYYEVFGY